LKDTVIDYAEAEESTGFRFQPFESEALANAMGRALDVFQDPESWQALQSRAMQQDFSWDRSANEYHQLYQEMMEQV
jgi:starch synthase